MEASKAELVRLIRARSSQMEPHLTGVEPRLTPRGRIRAVIFDVYGTLFISGAGDISHSIKANRDGVMAEVLAEFSIKLRDERAKLSDHFFRIIAEHHEKERQKRTDFPEVDIVSVWEELVKGEKTRQFFENAPDRATLEKVAAVYECRVNPVWPMPRLKNVLETLHQRGIPMGIVSNAQFFTPLLFPALADVDTNEVFEAELCQWSYQHLVAKPSVALFVNIEAELKKRDITPAETVYVGNDMLNDIYAADKQGFQTALFAGDKRSLRLREEEEHCQNLQPDYIITELRQLLTIAGA